MKLCAGQCKYLIVLYHLCHENSIVKSVDIANTLSVTRPSVSRMLKCMANLGLINQDYSSNVSLTEKDFVESHTDQPYRICRYKEYLGTITVFDGIIEGVGNEY